MSAQSASIPPAGIACSRPVLLSLPAKPAVPRRSISRLRTPAPPRHLGRRYARPERQLTDQAIDLFDRLVGVMFRKAEGRHARAFQADGRAINEKVRLYARVGAALIMARETEQDPFAAITAVIPWERFRASVAEAGALARSEEFEPYQMLGEHYAGVRRWAPAFFATFAFQGVPAAASLLRAIDMLRDMNEAARPKLPKSAPTGFIPERWARHVLPVGAIDRRFAPYWSMLSPILNGSSWPSLGTPSILQTLRLSARPLFELNATVGTSSQPWKLALRV